MTRRRIGLDEAGSQDDGAQALRKRAEEIVRAKKSLFSEPELSEQVRGLLNELQTHQIELEMQNDELRQTQERLGLAYAKYFDFYNISPVGYFTISGHGLVLESNLTAANLLGIPRDRLAKQPFTKLIIPDDKDIYYQFDKHLLETGKPQTCELRMARSDGTRLWAFLGGTVADDAQGAPVCYLVMSDISDSKRKEEEKREALESLQKISSQLPGVIFQFRLRPDGSSCVPYASEAIRYIWRLSPEDVREDASKVFAVVHPDDLGAMMASIQTSARDLTKWHHEFRLKFGNEPERWLLGDALPQRESDGSTLWHGFITDITERRLTAAALYKTRSFLGTLAALAPVGIFHTDMEGACLYANNRWLEIAGMKSEDALGVGWALAIHPEDRDIVSKSWYAATIEQKPFNMEYRFQRPDSNIVWVIGQAHIERDEAGLPIGYVGTITDITERKRVDEELQRFFNLVPDMVCIASTEGYFLKINPMWERTLGYSAKEILSMPFLDLIHPDDRDATMSEVARQIGGEATIMFINRYRCKDGGYKWFEWMATPSPDKKQLFAAARDITERVRAEKALKAAKEEAERANKAKSIFLSSMSHEIRTPLTAVMGFSQLLASDTEHPLNDFQKTLLGKVVDSGNQLLGLVNNVLDLAKIESGDIEVAVTAVDMKSMAEIALTGSTQMATTYGVKLSSKPPAADCYVMADMLRLNQVLTHLLSNAIQFNKKGGETILSWGALDENKARISVSDEGVGISEDNIKNLYQPFDRLGFEGLNIKGFGVGLTLAKRLVELMGGEVGVESQVGKGSTFYIDLPAGKKPE
jgi:PAS domain S-box-containing protein